MRTTTLLLTTILTLAATPAVMPVNVMRTVTVDRGAQDPAVSPDGQWLAVSILGKIFLMPIAGGDAQQLSNGLSWDTHPAWSPDGLFVAWAQQLPDGTDIVLHELTSGLTRFVYHNESGIGQIAFDPNGAELYFVLDRNQYDAHVWRVRLAGDSAAKQITQTSNWHEWSFALSPDGNQMLLESGRFGGADLYTLRLPGREVTRLTRTPANEFGVGWARDGRKVWVSGDNGVDRVMVQPAGGGDAKAIFSSPYDQKTLSLTPDGKSAVIAGGRKLYRIDLATGDTAGIPFVANIAVPGRVPGNLVITNARLFTGTGNTYQPNATVVVKDGRISSIGGEVPKDATVLDAGGKVVMAGLTDNHWHYWSPSDGGRLLARGVTAIRDPGVGVSTSMNFKDAIHHGILPGPTIYTAGPLIDGPGGYHPAVDVALDRPEAAAPLVKALKAQGVDALKVYFLLDPPVLAAVVKEAKVQGLPVTGHIGVRTSYDEALAAGINGFSHVRVWKDFLPPELQPQGENESLDGSRNPIARMQADWSLIDPDGPAATALIRKIAQSGAMLDPTLAIHRIDETARQRFSLEQFQVARDSYKRVQRFVRNAQAAGVKILAGTDNGSIFDELEAYADAGIPNVEILRSVTSNGAQWLGKSADFGTVEVGKRADLIVVDGDPLADIKALRRVTTVIKDGRIVVRR